MATRALPEQENDKQMRHSRRVYLLTSPRTASNLFVKMLNVEEQPNMATNSYYAGYFFMPAFCKRNDLDKWDVPYDNMAEDHKRIIRDDAQAAADHFRAFCESAKREGRVVFAKEHVNMMMKSTLLDQLIHGTPVESVPPSWVIHMDEATDRHSIRNPTFLPDDWLETFQPTFLIRHPALQIPSFYRVHLEGRGPNDTASRKAYMRATYTLVAFRQMYDFYAKHFRAHAPSSPWPLVIDAAELTAYPMDVMRHFCSIAGFDFSKCKFKWELASRETVDELPNNVERRAFSTLHASTGVLSGKTSLSVVDVEVEATKWKAEFGEEVAKEIETFVRRSLPDYVYLRRQRWSPSVRSD